MKSLIILLFSTFFLSFLVKSQTIKNGIIYDTLTTIENDEFLVSQAIMTFLNEGYGTFNAEIYITLVAKKNMKLKFTKYWFRCIESDLVKAAEEWGGIEFEEFKIDSQYYRISQLVDWVYVDSIPSVKLDCEVDPLNHIVRGWVFEYYLGEKKKYLTIDKFKFIPYFKLNDYFIYRTYILNKTKSKQWKKLSYFLTLC